MASDSSFLQVVKESNDPSDGKVRVAQAQDAIISCMFHECVVLLLAQTKALVYRYKDSDLWERTWYPRKGLGTGSGSGLGY